MLRELKDFLLRGNLIEVAVALVLALALTAVVTSLVEDLITPLIAALFGQPDFAGLTFEINDSVFRYGEVIDAAISFVAIAAVVFFVIVKPMQAVAARRAAGAPTDDTPAPSDEALLLTEIRDLLASRQL